ncbi:DUF3099 domain-containing protein [Curtobacterium ammoniigenes]|uniref:DUF3099 domain-containing protein n=1 Tax=Curtobacterium ammoniigenes TaxID=395387 RepID=UPI000831E5A4|nr:DUF3099 domain-containing protein [Curtobacterium ammoniigenes]
MKTTTNTITTLAASPDQDRRRRFRRYVWQMAIRVFFFVIAVLLHNWWSVVPLVLAAVIPWVAVVIANAGNRASGDISRPAGALVRQDPEFEAAREAAEQQREQAYRDEQDARRRAAEDQQAAWQREGARPSSWGHRR